MNRELIFTPTASRQYEELQDDPAKTGVLKQVQKTLAFLETNIRHPSLKTHEYGSLRDLKGEKVFEAYVQHRTPDAYRVFFHYGPDRHEEGQRVPIITIIAITPHP